MNNPEFQFQTDIQSNRKRSKFAVCASVVYLNVPGSLDVLAVVSPVSGATEPLGAELPLEYPRHLDAVLGLEHVAAVCDEVLHYTQARIPVLSTGEILEDEERLLCLRIYLYQFYSLWKNHIRSS